MPRILQILKGKAYLDGNQIPIQKAISTYPERRKLIELAFNTGRTATMQVGDNKMKARRAS